MIFYCNMFRMIVHLPSRIILIKLKIEYHISKIPNEMSQKQDQLINKIRGALRSSTGSLRTPPRSEFSVFTCIGRENITVCYMKADQEGVIIFTFTFRGSDVRKYVTRRELVEGEMTEELDYLLISIAEDLNKHMRAFVNFAERLPSEKQIKELYEFDMMSYEALADRKMVPPRKFLTFKGHNLAGDDRYFALSINCSDTRPLIYTITIKPDVIYKNIMFSDMEKKNDTQIRDIEFHKEGMPGVMKYIEDIFQRNGIKE